MLLMPWIKTAIVVNLRLVVKINCVFLSGGKHARLYRRGV